jgi:hypothetical protein
LINANSHSAYGINAYNSGTLNVNINRANGTGTFGQLSGSETINWNNSDSSAPVDFTKILKTKKGFFASPSNSSLTGYTGTYNLYVPHVSDGTNLRSLVNPTANYY